MGLKNSRYIKTELGIYKRVLETREHIFFVNELEPDENACVKMYNRRRELISDNYHAYGAFMEILEKKNQHKIWWIEEGLKKHLIEKKLWKIVVDKK
jgi:hypothetical protein